MNSTQSLILIVDDADCPVSVATKDEAQQAGLYHRIVRIMVEDPAGRVLLQLRSPMQVLYPDCWDASAAGHVDEAEDYLDAANRELYEEIGLRDLSLQEIGYDQTNTSYGWRQLKRFSKIYRVVVPADTQFDADETEVAKLQWFTVTDLKRLLIEQPDDFTDGLARDIQRYY